MNYLRANGCGNTFLIFDFIENNQIECNINTIKGIHEKEGYKNIDSCLLLYSDSCILNDIDSDSLVIEMDVFEKDDVVVQKDKFCGNGARVVSQYLHEKYKNKKEFFIKKNNTLVHLYKKDDVFGVDMGKVSFIDNKKEFFVSDLEYIDILFLEKEIRFFYVYVNEPHLITFVPLSYEMLYYIGSDINQTKKNIFPLGINVNTIIVLNEKEIKINTYERGVEDITKACGTGSTSAVALIMKLNIFSSRIKNINVINPGGVLEISKNNNNFYLFGPTEINY
jgi:diaminopimelate epimerase